MQISLSPEKVIKVTQPLSQRGGTSCTIERIVPLADAVEGDLSFLREKKFSDDLTSTGASIVFVPEDCPVEPGENQLFLYFENPSVGLARLCSMLQKMLRPRPVPGVHPTAVIAQGCRIPESVTVGPYCIIEDGCTIGEDSVLEAHVFIGRNSSLGEGCRLMPQVTVMDGTRLGDRVALHSGVVIGSDGFGYDSDGSGHSKIPQIGGVVIGDDVEIGAGTTIDRARFSDTVIGEGTKIDNLVQVGHNVRIGRHCILCAQVGIAGSTVLGDFVILGGQVGIAGHLTLGSGVQAGAQSGIGRNLEPKSYVFGSPAVPYMLRQKIIVLQKRLPDLFRRVDKIEADLEKAFEKGSESE